MDPMIQSATADLSQSQRDDLRTYVREHPEIRTILKDFMANLLMDKPENPKEFAAEYFGNLQKVAVPPPNPE
ncbi:hypothetical protein TVAG_316230 [Trichomonas vaginalis G3]|uniref:RIIa domain-containing protein n=1 Tax=Trichomonas vaginalis (strain ATCC PRA-98 / G3) TaxID=412133 RepID=A2FAY1_TRIV3|nr:ciliogenesis associated TTC17 interacting protein family [Trichomonas vaginalis G3]EAX97958.1 hypothetical protein TVAG_316230 [Trichomonas vaginalis G3]KAI5502555.1 ciliogenesis associated TTC17 interacting protein family [Trichomonas vaginalis G3]|eukprot:XP_001310888.1 hypothetical protein [Trichomonas vaginalis G3]